MTGESPSDLRARAVERRGELLAWMRERPEHEGLCTRQLVELSGIYDRPEYCGWLGSPISRATRDVNALVREGRIARVVFSRPARWEVSR
jgi:hypothetical protein